MTCVSFSIWLWWFFVVFDVRGKLGVLGWLWELTRLALDRCSGVVGHHFVVWRVSLLHLVCMCRCTPLALFVFLVMVASHLLLPPTMGPCVLVLYQSN